MENEGHIVVTAQFKVILKEILEKLRLPAAIYECQKHGPDHQPWFVAKVKFEDELGEHEQYGFRACTKKEAENEAALRAIRHLQDFNNIIIKDVSERELHELKYELKDFKDANEILAESLDMITNELKELKTKMKIGGSEQSESNEDIIMHQ